MDYLRNYFLERYRNLFKLLFVWANMKGTSLEDKSRENSSEGNPIFRVLKNSLKKTNVIMGALLLVYGTSYIGASIIADTNKDGVTSIREWEDIYKASGERDPLRIIKYYYDGNLRE
ncbi:hypothetical protein CMI42_06130 [Candidatus Pacearchaeota archaeon]|nr:hypothetical protein [Candidatus Pacearchaeota archaeon]